MTKPIRFERLKPCIDWWEKREANEVAWKVTIDEIKARNYNLDFKNPHTVEEDHGDPAELLAKLEESEAEIAKLRDRCLLQISKRGIKGAIIGRIGINWAIMILATYGHS